MSALFLFYKQISSFNVPFSLLAGLLTYSQGIGFFVGFFMSLLTVGFALALYLYQLRNSNQYLFYYNLGWSKIKLIGVSFVINSSILSIYLLLF